MSVIERDNNIVYFYQECYVFGTIISEVILFQMFPNEWKALEQSVMTKYLASVSLTAVHKSKQQDCMSNVTRVIAKHQLSFNF